jgi:uncharacterized protein with ATP-grasp and redox domains
LSALDRAVQDENVKFEVMKEVTQIAGAELDEHTNLPILSTRLFRLISRNSGNPDPFKEDKEECNRIALPIADELMVKVLGIDDPEARLRTAIMASIAGNTMDLGTAGHSFDTEAFEEEYLATISQGLAIDHTAELLAEFKPDLEVLYLADNAGEIAFDKILVAAIQGLGSKVTVAVKGGPISNDATIEDAEYVGMGRLARVITTGTDHLGINMEESSEEFLRAWGTAGLVISKGQSNLETICFDPSVATQPVAYVLKAKCGPVARSLGVMVGQNVVKLVRAPGDV